MSHRHADSVIVALTSFERRPIRGERETDVRLEVGTTDSHSFFVELNGAPGA